jgi:hypothetical protein
VTLDYAAKSIAPLLIAFAMLAGTNSSAQDAPPLAVESEVVQKFYEGNFGIAFTNIGLPFPGFSALWGARKLHTNGKTFTDLAVGPALPSLVTGRVGVGTFNSETKSNISFGVRIFPLYVYTRLGFPLKSRRFRGSSLILEKYDGAWCEREFSLSVEVSPFLESSSDAGEVSAFFSVALLTFGWTSFF